MAKEPKAQSVVQSAFPKMARLAQVTRKDSVQREGFGRPHGRQRWLQERRVCTKSRRVIRRECDGGLPGPAEDTHGPTGRPA